MDQSKTLSSSNSIIFITLFSVGVQPFTSHGNTLNYVVPKNPFS
jgi:hypothetical protein